MNLDLTYLLNYIIDFTLDKIEEFEDELEQIDSQLIYDESRQNDLNKTEEVVSSTPLVSPSNEKEVIIKEEKVPLSNNVSFNQQVSLPNIPVGLDEADASIVADNLLEIYPSMKKNQAEFYARHCTIGKYYTISQYKKEMNVVYETARTSMENLVMLGLYRKEPLKNKFVYTPVIKNDK
jgi:Mg2+ and Co2+ transporter CorA